MKDRDGVIQHRYINSTNIKKYNERIINVENETFIYKPTHK